MVFVAGGMDVDELVFLTQLVQGETRNGGDGYDDEEDDVCGICLEKKHRGQLIVELSCLHRFHKICAEMSLLVNAICPVCRGYCLLEIPDAYAI